jgi:hypothetical protein
MVVGDGACVCLCGGMVALDGKFEMESFPRFENHRRCLALFGRLGGLLVPVFLLRRHTDTAL